MRYIPLVLALMLCLSLPAGATLLVDFSSGADSRLTAFNTNPAPPAPPVVGLSYTGGQAVFSVLPPYTTADDWTNAWAGLYTAFGVSGDYTASTVMDPTEMVNAWPDLSSAGFSVGSEGIGYAEGSLSASDTADAWMSAATSIDLTGPTTFEIERVGSTIYFYYDDGSGLQLFATETGASTSDTGRIGVGFWAGGGPNSVAFDNLDVVTPEPATWSFGFAAGLFGLALYRRRARKS